MLSRHRLAEQEVLTRRRLNFGLQLVCQLGMDEGARSDRRHRGCHLDIRRRERMDVTSVVEDQQADDLAAHRDRHAEKGPKLPRADRGPGRSRVAAGIANDQRLQGLNQFTRDQVRRTAEGQAANRRLDLVPRVGDSPDEHLARVIADVDTAAPDLQHLARPLCDPSQQLVHVPIRWGQAQLRERGQRLSVLLLVGVVQGHPIENRSICDCAHCLSSTRSSREQIQLALHRLLSPAREHSTPL